MTPRAKQECVPQEQLITKPQFETETKSNSMNKHYDVTW